MTRTFVSANQRMHWPAVPRGPGARMLSVLFQLERSERLPEAELLAAQRRQVRGVLSHAVEHVPYYRERRGEYDPAAVLEGDRWHAVPVLTRATLQRSEQQLVSEALKKSGERLYRIESSGSTGRPVRVLHNIEAQFMWHVFTLREHLWHGRDEKAKLASIKHYRGNRNAYPGVTRDGWGPGINLVLETGPIAVLNSATDVAIQSEWLRHHQPRYLLTYPSNLKALARRFVEEGVTLPGLEQVRTLGETVDDSTRQWSREAWGVGVADMYSAQEVGYIALQCPDVDGAYHVQSENVLAEVVDEADRPCAPGETGRLLVTALHNLAMPLIRYEIGDYAVAGTPCPCGRTLPTFERILGRSRNMLRLPDGSTRWPTFGNSSWSRELDIRQFQFVQTGLAHLEVRLVVGTPLAADEERRIADEVRKRIGYPVDIAFRYMDDIPRSASGKFEDFRSELA